MPQAILAKAFRSELVPTEAELARAEGHSYEPARRRGPLPNVPDKGSTFVEEGKDSRVSTYILTCRVKPGEVLKDINFKFNFEGGYIIDFVHDLAVVTFDAVEGDWDQKREQAYKYLETIISGITLQVEYPFEIEPIQFVQDKPRDEVDSKSFLYGKLGPLEPIIQASPPIVTNKHFQQASFFVAVSELEPYFRMAMVDYRAAQRFPPESIVFCARALEWAEEYFEQTTGSGAGGANQSARDIMRRELCLPKKPRPSPAGGFLFTLGPAWPGGAAGSSFKTADRPIEEPSPAKTWAGWGVNLGSLGPLATPSGGLHCHGRPGKNTPIVTVQTLEWWTFRVR